MPGLHLEILPDDPPPRARAFLHLAFSICIVSLASCDRPTVAGKVPITIRFWNGFTGPDGRAMLGLIKQFNDANPDINVTMQRMDWGLYYNKLFVAGLGGRAGSLRGAC